MIIYTRGLTNDLSNQATWQSSMVNRVHRISSQRFSSLKIREFLWIKQSIYAIYQKKNKWTTNDCYKLSVSIFSLSNLVISPWTIEANLESEQQHLLDTVETDLQSQEAEPLSTQDNGNGEVSENQPLVLRNLIII
ncbi:hypothetical protein PENTCL1PPCAC_4680, partial [Pristionchus entomophagus]